MKRFYIIMMLLASTTLFTIGGCKKDSTNTTETDLTSDVTIQSDDHSMFSSEDDAVSDDVNATIISEPLFSGKSARTTSVICDATVTRDSTLTTRSLVITYNGTNCTGTRTRTGVVTLTMGKNVKWKDVGATLTVNVQNLKITRTRDNKSLTLNGTKTIKNATGHLLSELASFSPILHISSSTGMSAAFDNGTTRQWQIAKQREFTYNNGVVISETGNGGATADVAVWGTNRLGQEFSTRIINPLVVRQDCNFRLVSGKVEHTKLTRPITVTFGLDSTGNATTCPAAGSYYYFKAEWTSILGVAHSVVRPY